MHLRVVPNHISPQHTKAYQWRHDLLGRGVQEKSKGKELLFLVRTSGIITSKKGPPAFCGHCKNQTHQVAVAATARHHPDLPPGSCLPGCDAKCLDFVGHSWWLPPPLPAAAFVALGHSAVWKKMWQQQTPTSKKHQHTPTMEASGFLSDINVFETLNEGKHRQQWTDPYHQSINQNHITWLDLDKFHLQRSQRHQLNESVVAAACSRGVLATSPGGMLLDASWQLVMAFVFPFAH